MLREAFPAIRKIKNKLIFLLIPVQSVFYLLSCCLIPILWSELESGTENEPDLEESGVSTFENVPLWVCVALSLKAKVKPSLQGLHEVT